MKSFVRLTAANSAHDDGSADANGVDGGGEIAEGSEGAAPPVTVTGYQGFRITNTPPNIDITIFTPSLIKKHEFFQRRAANSIF